MTLCSDMCQKLDDALLDGSRAALDGPALEHMRACPICKGYIEAVLADVFRQIAPDMFAAESPTHVGDDLPGYIDLERLSPREAELAYPAVRTHLARCPECYKDYVMINETLNDPNLALPGVPMAIASPTISPAIMWASLPNPLVGNVVTWSRPVINQLAQKIQSMEVLIRGQRGEGELPPAFYRRTLELGYSLSFRVIDFDDTHWWIVVTLDPPLRASVVLSFGDETFRAPFSEQGRATLPRIPASLFTEVEGPELNIRLE